MEIIQMKRGMGKTTLVLERVKSNPDSVMIVFSQRNMDSIIMDNKWIKGRIFTFSQWKDESCFIGTKFKEAYMDQADMCLNMFARVPITLITSDLEDKE